MIVYEVLQLNHKIDLNFAVQDKPLDEIILDSLNLNLVNRCFKKIFILKFLEIKKRGYLFVEKNLNNTISVDLECSVRGIKIFKGEFIYDPYSIKKVMPNIEKTFCQNDYSLAVVDKTLSTDKVNLVANEIRYSSGDRDGYIYVIGSKITPREAPNPALNFVFYCDNNTNEKNGSFKDVSEDDNMGFKEYLKLYKDLSLQKGFKKTIALLDEKKKTGTEKSIYNLDKEDLNHSLVYLYGYSIDTYRVKKQPSNKDIELAGHYLINISEEKLKKTIKNVFCIKCNNIMTFMDHGLYNISAEK